MTVEPAKTPSAAVRAEDDPTTEPPSVTADDESDPEEDPGPPRFP